jgi:predicted transcriptional regulator
MAGTAASLLPSIPDRARRRKIPYRFPDRARRPDIVPDPRIYGPGEEKGQTRFHVTSKRPIDITGSFLDAKAMARTPFTLRIDAEERTALQHLSKIEGRPINQLLNEAIKIYLRRRSPEEQNLEASLAGLRAYRKQDPGSQRAIAAFVEAEATLEDPLEGEPIDGQFVEGQFKPAGPVQSEIRDLLSD